MTKYLKDLKETALSGAQKICNSENCPAAFECERKAWQKPKNLLYPPTVLGNDTECRLLRLPVIKKESPGQITVEEMTALCTTCPYSKVIKADNGYRIDRSEAYYEHCLDCPVNAITVMKRETQTEERNS